MVNYHVGCCIRSSGTRLLVPSQVGYDWLDGILSLSNSGLLIPFASVLILEDGRFLLGCYSYCIR